MNKIYSVLWKECDIGLSLYIMVKFVFMLHSLKTMYYGYSKLLIKSSEQNLRTYAFDLAKIYKS